MPDREGNPSQPFDPKELSSLVANPAELLTTKDYDRERRMFQLISRAGAEKAAQFRTLLTNTELLKTPMLSLALAGYDYSVNGNQKALDFLLTKLAAQPVGSDSGVAGVLAFVDEWERSVAAVESHLGT